MVQCSTTARLILCTVTAIQNMAPSLTHHASLRKFKEFIHGFFSEKGEFLYRESLVHKPDHLAIPMEDMDAFDAQLAARSKKLPAENLPLLETAAAKVLTSLQSKVVDETGEMEEPVMGDVQIFLSSKQNSVSMCSIRAEYMSMLVMIAGITITASQVKAKATYVTLLCKNCKNIKSMACCPGLGRHHC